MAREKANSHPRPVSPLDSVLTMAPSPVAAISSSSIVNLNDSDFNLDQDSSGKDESIVTSFNDTNKTSRLNGKTVSSSDLPSEDDRDPSLLLSTTLSSTVANLTGYDADVSINGTALDATHNPRPSPSGMEYYLYMRKRMSIGTYIYMIVEGAKCVHPSMCYKDGEMCGHGILCGRNKYVWYCPIRY